MREVKCLEAQLEEQRGATAELAAQLAAGAEAHSKVRAWVGG